MKKSITKYIIIGLLTLLFTLAIGYAVFSDTLKITGTANAKGTFDLQFVSATVNRQIGVTSNTNENNEQSSDVPGTEINISNDKNTVNVAIQDLACPGAGVEFKVVIKNCGSVPAKLTNIRTTGTTDNDIKVTFPTFKVGEKLAVNATKEIIFQVVWDINSNYDTSSGSKQLDFSLQLDYEQDTKPFVRKASYSIK